MVHKFNESLEFAASNQDLPMWKEVYKKAFSGFSSMSSVKNDGWAQRGGIDRVITLSSGKTITVDEKIRREDWPDILLERWSNEARKVPGWVQKDLACDYIAYAFLPSKKCYLLPFQQLRMAWRQNGKEWINKYPRIPADNGTYKTISVPVPIKELLLAINDAMLVTWTES